MINCNTCGKQIPEDSEFCPFCGGKVIVSVSAIEQLHLYQPSALLTRAFLFIEEEEFDKADMYLEVVLNQEPENAQAYLGKLLIEMRVKSKADLINCDTSFEDSKNYQKVLRFGDASLIDELKQYLVVVKERSAVKAEEMRIENIYLTALDKYNSYDIAQIQEAIEAFASLEGYKNSERHIELCKARIEEVRIKEENNRIKAQQVAKRNKKIAITASPIIVVVLAFIIILNAVIIPNGNYNDAIALMDAGRYEAAIAEFEKLGGYKDSKDKISECETLILEDKYQAAVSLLERDKYAEAITAFEALGGYKDSALKIITCRNLILEDAYQTAITKMNSGMYADAIIAFEDLDGYKDSEAQITACENAITQNYETQHTLSDYTEVTIAEIWNNPTAFNGQKVKIVGYIGSIELDEPTYYEDFYDGYLVKEQSLANTSQYSYSYWTDTLKLKHQYIGFRIMFNTYFEQVSLGTPEVKNADKVVFYGTFTYNTAYIDEGSRYINDPHGYDILVDRFLTVNEKRAETDN